MSHCGTVAQVVLIKKDTSLRLFPPGVKLELDWSRHFDMAGSAETKIDILQKWRETLPQRKPAPHRGDHAQVAFSVGGNEPRQRTTRREPLVAN